MLLYLVLALFLQTGLGVDDEVFVTLKNRVCLVGGNATFICDIKTNTSEGMIRIDGPEKIVWSFAPLGSNASTVILNFDEDSKTKDSVSGVKYHREVWPHMTIHKLTEADAGLYTCTLEEAGLSASAELYIIDTMPVCTKSNDGPVYYEGDSVTLTCTMGFHGNQKPKLDWTVPENHVDYEHLKFEEENRANMISASVTLSLQHMIDGKPFTCAASFINISSSSSYGCTTMFKPQSVQYAPYISHLRTFPYTDENNHEVEEGSDITLACESHSNPPPKRMWKFYPKQSKTAVVLPCHLVTCPLKNLNMSNIGSYQCIVTNEVKGISRSATQTMYLKVKGKKGPPGTGAVPVDAEKKTGKKFSPYAIGAIVCASLALILIIVFILLALKMRGLYYVNGRAYIPTQNHEDLKNLLVLDTEILFTTQRQNV